MHSRGIKTGWGSLSAFVHPVQWGLIYVILLGAILAAMPCDATSEKKALASSPLDLNQKWTGDFDGMVKGRAIRVLVAHSKTFYFLDRGRQRGLDPNVWFYNVEIAAAREIGRETVQYVSNIYKYYTAYRIIYDQRKDKRKRRKEYAGTRQR